MKNSLVWGGLSKMCQRPLEWHSRKKRNLEGHRKQVVSGTAVELLHRPVCDTLGNKDGGKAIRRSRGLESDQDESSTGWERKLPERVRIEN